eukprot:379249-Hanusia_phi.AAC.4
MPGSAATPLAFPRNVQVKVRTCSIFPGAQCPPPMISHSCYSHCTAPDPRLLSSHVFAEKNEGSGEEEEVEGKEVEEGKGGGAEKRCRYVFDSVNEGLPAHQKTENSIG